MLIRKIAVPFVSLVLAMPVVAVAAEGFRDVLDTPALESAFAAKSLLNGVAAAGKRLVAVGQRGHIVYSDDGGKTWNQAKVPVSSDLVAVSFPTPRRAGRSATTASCCTASTAASPGHASSTDAASVR